jgi:molecular chaperone GrpE
MTPEEKPEIPPSAEPGLPVAGEGPPPDRVAEPAPADPAPDIGALLEKAEAEAAELKDAWLRARADVENVRKQAAGDVARAQKYAIERFASDLLQVKDSLEAALAAADAPAEALRSGVLLTLKQLAGAFEKAQIAEVDPAGQKFDPHQHMAMTTVESPEPPNTVVRVFQKGYRLQDRILRPALVAVSKAPESA